MPSKDTRRLMFIDKQPVISLPRGWVKFWDLKRFDTIPVYYDSIFIVIPPNHPHRKEIEKNVENFLITNEPGTKSGHNLICLCRHSGWEDCQCSLDDIPFVTVDNIIIKKKTK